MAYVSFARVPRTRVVKKHGGEWKLTARNQAVLFDSFQDRRRAACLKKLADPKITLR